MKLKIAQVIGLNTDQKAAQATSSTRDGDSFLAVLELRCDDAFTKGRIVLSELEDFYFELEGGAAEKLNATFKEAEKKFSKDNDFDLCLAAISGKALYLIGKGQVEVYLKRGEKLSPLLSVGAPSQLISGFVSFGDRILLSTTSLVTFLGGELEKSLSLPIERFEEEVGSKIDESVTISQSISHSPSEAPEEESQYRDSDLENQGLAALVVEVTEEDMEISALPSEVIGQENHIEHTEQKVSEDYPKKPFVLFQVILSNTFTSLKRLGRYFPRSGRGRLAVAVILIAIIALGAGYKFKLSSDAEKQLQFTQMLQEAKDDFNGAKGLATLNPLEAKNKLDSAKDKLNKALKLKPEDSEAQNFQKQLEQESSEILQTSSISDFPVFLDLDLVKKNFRADKLSLSAGKLLLLDPGVKTLVAVDLVKKSNQILAGSEQLGDAPLASLNGGLSFIYSVDKGILKIDTTNSKLSTVAKADEDWGEIADIYGFAGNIYLLDKNKNQIWKYLPTSEGYSDKREYLNKDTKVDFNGALRMQIESSVYVLKSGGEILRFTRGDKDNFSLGGLDKEIKDPKSFFVSSDTDNLYLLDSGNSRLLTLTKTGAYKGQISGDKFATATDLVVDEKNKKVYLLEGSKIFQVELK